MRVAQLVEMLGKYPQDSVVLIEGDDCDSLCLGACMVRREGYQDCVDLTQIVVVLLANPIADASVFDSDGIL